MIRLSRGRTTRTQKDHQTRNHHVGSRPQKEGLVESEAGHSPSLQIGSEVTTVETEQVDVGENE
jgi:hypothetical protein